MGRGCFNALVQSSHSHCRGRNRIPRNLLDDLANKGGALAQMTLGPGRLWLDDAGLGFLYCAKSVGLARCWTVHRLQRAGGSEGILQEVRRTWPLLSPTARPVRGVSLAILTELGDVEMCWSMELSVVVEIGNVKSSRVGILCVRVSSLGNCGSRGG